MHLLEMQRLVAVNYVEEMKNGAGRKKNIRKRASPRGARNPATLPEGSAREYRQKAGARKSARGTPTCHSFPEYLTHAVCLLFDWQRSLLNRRMTWPTINPASSHPRQVEDGLSIHTNILCSQRAACQYGISRNPQKYSGTAGEVHAAFTSWADKARRNPRSPTVSLPRPGIPESRHDRRSAWRYSQLSD